MQRKPHLFLLMALAGTATVAAGPASATDLYGGGASFPAPAYVGDAYNHISPRARLSRAPAITVPAVAFAVAGIGNNPGGPNASLTPIFATALDGVSYCQTGSSIGKSVLNNDVLVASGACGDVSRPSATGFSALSPTPDFIGTDVPTSTADYQTFKTNINPTRGAITQIPVLAGAVAVTYNKAGVATPLALNAEKLCKIFGKVVTNWNDPALGLSGVSGDIKIVYRSDGSGTSFALSTYLSGVCSTFGVTIIPNQKFAVAVGGVSPSWVGVSSDGTVVGMVKATDGAIGYSSLAEVQAQTAEFATVNGFSPVDMPRWLNLSATRLIQGQVLDGATLNSIPGLPPLTSAQQNCLKLISPSIPVSAGYPIVAVTYINTYYYGHVPAQATAVKNLLKVFYSTKVESGVTVPAGPNLPRGYSYLHANAVFRALVNIAINNCVN